MSNFTDKIAVITGGTRGIGKAISRRFASDNFLVIMIYANNDEIAHTTQTEFSKNGFNELFIVSKT